MEPQAIKDTAQIDFLWLVSWPIAIRIWLCSEKSKVELLRPSSSNLPGWWTTQRQKLANFHFDPRFLRQQLLHLQYLYHIPLFKVNWTRISEYKHSPNQPAGVRDYPGTVVSISISTCTVVSINHYCPRLFVKFCPSTSTQFQETFFYEKNVLNFCILSWSGSSTQGSRINYSFILVSSSLDLRLLTWWENRQKNLWFGQGLKANNSCP